MNHKQNKRVIPGNLKIAVGVCKHKANRMDFFDLMKILPGDVKSIIGKLVNSYKVYENTNITMVFIDNNPDKNWSWYYISRNPNIDLQRPTKKYIIDNPDIGLYLPYIDRKLKDKDIHKRMNQAERMKIKDINRRYMTTNHINRHQKKVKKRYNNRY